MSDNLYFIRILQEACGQPDQPAAFAAALRRIQSLGEEPRYRRGHRQFLHLFECAARSEQTLSPVLDDVIAAVIGEIVGFPALEGMSARRTQASRWGRRFEEFAAAIRDEAQRSVPATMFVEFGEQTCGQVTVGQMKVVPELLPGQYCLRLDTGLILWEGTLEAQDLLWQAAPANQALRAAAATPQLNHPPSRTFRLLHGQVMVELHRGWQVGSMRISFQEQRRSPR